MELDWLVGGWAKRLPPTILDQATDISRRKLGLQKGTD